MCLLVWAFFFPVISFIISLFDFGLIVSTSIAPREIPTVRLDIIPPLIAFAIVLYHLLFHVFDLIAFSIPFNPLLGFHFNTPSA